MLNKRIVIFAVAMSALWTASQAEEELSPRDRYGSLLREDRQLRNLSALADSADFYLVLDLDQKELGLWYRGVPVREYTAHAIDLGRPGRFFHRARVSGEWYDQIWTDGKLDPVRHRTDETLGATEDSTGFDPDWVPMLPEELIISPDRYEIEFENGPVVEVVADSTQSGPGAWQGWVDRARALFSTRLRLRLTLDPEDAAELYRSLPPETELALRGGNPVAEMVATKPGDR
jgi:hypothetical protein